MFPFLRLGKEMLKTLGQSKLEIDGTHVSHHICWPIDLDFMLEANNGRVLSLYDLGRIPLAARTGLLRALFENGWAFAMAGASVRYRRRIKMFDRFEMQSRSIGHDGRFFYLEQTMWKKGEAASNILYRAAVTDASGIVPTQSVLDAMGYSDWNPEMPEWVQAWIHAEAKRPWPPAQI